MRYLCRVTTHDMKKLFIILALLSTACSTHMTQRRYGEFLTFSQLGHDRKQMLLELTPDEVTLEMKGDSVTLWLYGVDGQYVRVRTSVANVTGRFKNFER